MLSIKQKYMLKKINQRIALEKAVKEAEIKLWNFLKQKKAPENATK